MNDVLRITLIALPVAIITVTVTRVGYWYLTHQHAPSWLVIAIAALTCFAIIRAL
jgi:hypothetical protein